MEVAKSGEGGLHKVRARINIQSAKSVDLICSPLRHNPHTKMIFP